MLLDRSVPISVYLQPVPSRPPCWSRCFSTSWPWVCPPSSWPPWPPCGCSPSSWPPCGSRCHLAFPQGGTGSASRETGSAGKPSLRCLGGIFLGCKNIFISCSRVYGRVCKLCQQLRTVKKGVFQKTSFPHLGPRFLALGLEFYNLHLLFSPGLGEKLNKW